MKIEMEKLVPLIVEVISSGAAFRLYPNGESMLPTIVAGKDSVELVSPKELKKYDIALYKRENGQYVLHRIERVHKEHFDMCGDNQLEIEKGIKKESVIAVVQSIYKEEKQIKPSDKEYVRQVKRLYGEKKRKRLVSKVKRFLYPAYRLIVKK